MSNKSLRNQQSSSGRTDREGGGASRYPPTWGSYDHFSTPPSRLPLPPQMAPLRRMPGFCSMNRWMPPPQAGSLRRWNNSYSINELPPQQHGPIARWLPSSRRYEPRYRSEVGSMQQLPLSHHRFSTQAKVPPWHYSHRDIPDSHHLVCVFCKSNREPPEVYTSHIIRVDGRVTCPVLRKYVCKFCQATGDQAHTDSYCPRNPNRGFRSSMKSVLKTPIMSSGKKRMENKQ